MRRYRVSLSELNGLIDLAVADMGATATGKVSWSSIASLMFGTSTKSRNLKRPPNGRYYAATQRHTRPDALDRKRHPANAPP